MTSQITYNSDDLLQHEREADNERFWFVDDRPLQLIIDSDVIEAKVVD